MTRAQADAAVDAIFKDLRNRKFLKWMFCKDPENFGPILHERTGEPLMPLDTEVQDEIRDAWAKLIMASDA